VALSYRCAREIIVDRENFRYEIGTTKQATAQSRSEWTMVPDPQKMVENGDNYCTALKRNMGRSAHGNFVQ